MCALLPAANSFFNMFTLSENFQKKTVKFTISFLSHQRIRMNLNNNNNKLLCFVLLMVFQQSVFAAGGGIGFTAGAGLEHWSDENNLFVTNKTYSLDGSRKLGNYGFVVDNNISKNRLFNYRFSLNRETNKPRSGNGLEFDGISMTHDFGFGFYRSRGLRIWAGPRIYFGFSEHVDQTEAPANTSTDGIIGSYGYGPVLGLNINSIDVVSISITYAYLFKNYYGDFWVDDNTSSSRDREDIDVESSGSYLNISLLFQLYK